jgi:dolichol-phosphate mannosyltransferase
MTAPPRVSIAIPLHNEEETVAELLHRVGTVLDATPGGPHEVVIVDDGSSDGTLGLLQDAAARDDRLLVVSLSRNFGHQAALSAGLDHVTGDVVVTMDGDLQDPPEAIPALLAKLGEGYDVVYAQRVNRSEPWWLRLSYYTFYRILSSLSSLQLPLDAGDFSIMSRRVVEQIRKAPERQRYIRGLRSWVGFKQVGMAIERPARFAGSSKYSLRRLVGLAFDGIFAFSTLPLRAAAVLGALAIALSTAFAVYSLFAKIFLSQTPRGFTALVFIITFLSGVNLLFLGVIGEYIGRVYEEVKTRPLYVVQKIIGRPRALP